MDTERWFEWSKFIFPSIAGSSEDFSSELDDQLEEETELLMQILNIIYDTCPPLREPLLKHVEELFTQVKQSCIEFSRNMDTLQLFETEADMEGFLRMMYMDCLNRSLESVVEMYEMYMDRWLQFSSSSEQAYIQMPVVKAKARSRLRSKEPKTRPNISREARDVLSKWFGENVDNPYPKAQDKEKLSELTGLTVKKVENWFINERSRKWHLYSRSAVRN